MPEPRGPRTRQPELALEELEPTWAPDFVAGFLPRPISSNLFFFFMLARWVLGLKRASRRGMMEVKRTFSRNIERRVRRMV